MVVLKQQTSSNIDRRPSEGIAATLQSQTWSCHCCPDSSAHKSGCLTGQPDCNFCCFPTFTKRLPLNGQVLFPVKQQPFLDFFWVSRLVGMLYPLSSYDHRLQWSSTVSIYSNWFSTHPTPNSINQKKKGPRTIQNSIIQYNTPTSPNNNC